MERNVIGEKILNESAVRFSLGVCDYGWRFRSGGRSVNLGFISIPTFILNLIFIISILRRLYFGMGKALATPLSLFALHTEGAALGHGKAAGLALLQIS